MRFHRLFFILTILFLPIQLGYHFWPDWSLVLGRRIDYLSPTLFLTDITLCLTVVSWMIEERRKIHPTKTQIYLTLGVIGYMFINIALSLHHENAIYQWMKYIEFMSFGYYVVRTKPVKIFIFPLVISLWFSIGLTYIQSFLQHSVGGIFWFFGERTFSVFTPGIAKLNWCFPDSLHCRELLRPYATFPHPNVLAGFFALVLPGMLYMAGISKQRIIRLIAYGTYLAGSVALFLTFSRSAWLLTMIMSAYVISRTSKTKKIWWMIGVSLIIVCCVLGIPYIRTISFHDESVFLRKDLFVAAWTLWKNHLFFGIGAGNYIPMLPTVLPSRDLFSLQPVHNIFMLLLTEFGLVGFLGIGTLICRTIIIYLKRIVWIHWLPFLTLCILGLIDHYPLTLQQGLFMLTLSYSLGFSTYSKN